MKTETHIPHIHYVYIAYILPIHIYTLHTHMQTHYTMHTYTHTQAHTGTLIHTYPVHIQNLNVKIMKIKLKNKLSWCGKCVTHMQRLTLLRQAKW